jgi:hypothetical protein
VYPSRVPDGYALEENIVCRYVVTLRRAMKLRVREGAMYCSALTLHYSLDEGGWSTQRSGRFNPGKLLQSPLHGKL